MAILSDRDDDIDIYGEIHTEDSSRDIEIKVEDDGSEGSKSGSDTTIKTERPVSPTPYVPQFPNLPSGIAWYARQKALLGNTSPEPTIVPKHERASVPRKRAKKDVATEKERSIPTRSSARNKNESALSHSAPSGEPIESTFTLRKGTSFGHLLHVLITIT